MLPDSSFDRSSKMSSVRVLQNSSRRLHIVGRWRSESQQTLLQTASHPENNVEEQQIDDKTDTVSIENNKLCSSTTIRHADTKEHPLHSNKALEVSEEHHRSRRFSLISMKNSLGQSLRRLSLHISSSPRHYNQQQIDTLLTQLSPKELHQAACAASFEYLKRTQQQGGSAVSSTESRVVARPWVEKFLNAKKDPNRALHAMKATLQFRTEMDLNGLCLAFEENNPYPRYRQALQEQLASTMLRVQGYDREGRSTYVFIPRLVQGHDDEWTLKEHLYTLERAIACSRASDRTVNAVVDFNGFSVLRHAPPTRIGKQFMTTLRKHYAGSVHQIFLIDAPFAFHTLWKVFKPLLGSQTRHKIHFVKSNRANNRLTTFYDADQAALLIPTDEQFELEEYLHQTPFDRAFGKGQP